MRLLVTGGAGYIGSIVAQQLLERGDEVTVLDSLDRGHRGAVPPGAAFVQADLLDADAVNAAVNGFDGVLHIAAKCRMPSKPPSSAEATAAASSRSASTNPAPSGTAARWPR